MDAVEEEDWLLDSGGTYGHAEAEEEGCVTVVGGGPDSLEEDELCIGQPGYDRSV